MDQEEYFLNSIKKKIDRGSKKSPAFTRFGTKKESDLNEIFFMQPTLFLKDASELI